MLTSKIYTLWFVIEGKKPREAWLLQGCL